MRQNKRECERKWEIEKYLYMNVRISDIMYDSYEEREQKDRGKKKERERKREREREIGHAMVQHGPTMEKIYIYKEREIERKRRRIERQATRTTIKNGRYHKCHYPSNPSATESMRNNE